MNVAEDVAALGGWLIETLTYEIGDPDGWPLFAGTGEIFFGNGMMAWDSETETMLPNIPVPGMPDGWEPNVERPRYDEFLERAIARKEYFSNQLAKIELIQFVKCADPVSGFLQLGELAQLVEMHFSDVYENNLISVKFATSGALASQLSRRQQRHERLLVLSKWLVLLGGIESKVEPPFPVTKIMLDSFYGNVIETESLMKSKKVNWPVHIKPWIKGADKKWDYVSVRQAIEKFSYSKRGLLLEYLPKSPIDAKKKYLELTQAVSTGND